MPARAGSRGRRRSLSSPERPASGQRLEEHDAERPQVGARVQRVPVDLLRRHVRDRPQSGARSREGEVAHLGQAEIQDLHGAVGKQHHVRRLEVAMHDAGMMRGAQAPHDWAATCGAYVSGSLPSRSIRALGSPPRKAAWCGKIAVRRLPGLEDRTEVGMIQRGRRPRLVEEPLEAAPIGVAGVQGNLERDRRPSCVSSAR